MEANPLLPRAPRRDPAADQTQGQPPPKTPTHVSFRWNRLRPGMRVRRRVCSTWNRRCRKSLRDGERSTPIRPTTAWNRTAGSRETRSARLRRRRARRPRRQREARTSLGHCQTRAFRPQPRGLRTLSGKLEALRSEWSEGKTGDREIALLREQISAVRSSLPSLAPREAVEALEASLGALVQRVDALGRTERRQPAHACMDSVGDELDEASGAYDAKIVLADIERQ